MKKQILFLAIVILMAGIAQAAIKPNVIVSGFDIKEGSAGVGKDFTLVITLINTEQDTCAKNIITTVQANYPFIINGISSITAEELCKGSTTTVNFPMKIDPTATGGSYQLIISNDYETTTLAQFSSTSTINVFINGTPNINANIINSNPIDVYTGDTATLTVNIENDGTFQAQSLTAKITAEQPLEVKWAKSFSAIGLLDSKQSKTTDFTIGVPKDAEAKDYKLELEVSYKDENLVAKTKKFNFLMHIRKKAMFETTGSSTETLYQNQNAKTIQLNLTNTGTDTAYKIKVKLLPQYPFSTDGSVKYIEQLDEKQTTPLKFTIDIDKDGTPGTYGLDILLDFEDAQGKKLQDTAKASFTIQQKSMFRAVIIDYWFIWAAIIVITIITIKKRIGKKNKK